MVIFDITPVRDAGKYQNSGALIHFCHIAFKYFSGGGYIIQSTNTNKLHNTTLQNPDPTLVRVFNCVKSRGVQVSLRVGSDGEKEISGHSRTPSPYCMTWRYKVGRQGVL